MSPDMGDKEEGKSTRIIIILSFSLLGLIALLIFFYKKLNRETNGEYTINNMVFKEGGLRDQTRSAVLTLETHLGVQLWPRGDTDEYGEEMQEVQDNEAQVEEGGSQGSDSEVEDEEGEEEEEEDEEEEEAQAGGGNRANENTGEKSVLLNQTEVKTNDKKEEEERNVREGGGEGEPSGGAGLLINLQQFSGSAIWSEDEGAEGKDKVVTAL
ncbi:glutamic acid-rich protein-like [Echeneis naucrates]|uniref:glutamic acid-rich protein-like n=1 Tax=Echeneis naucrates TaxID=173247 RepID=UPI001113560E|nr:glutamic acid-rich protein-like [Echeneis naucrates]XP_029382501.1 glutamic acid-rich protein-like [Echeneis naucrates]